MNFAEAESYLLSLGNEVETMKLGLANITALLEGLGKPHDRYTKVQVAGTNGKGSVCAFLNSICLEAGVRTGMYTSPHLISIRERIKIDGADISEEDFGRLTSVVRETSESLVAAGKLDRVPTFFEQVTAIALIAFAEANVELAILETGLGGRFDATTAACADVAVITRIDIDHQEYLGDTIEQIAAEKAAIIREDSSVVIGAQSPEAMKIVLERCEAVGTKPSNTVYSQWTVSPNGSGSVSVRTDRHIFPEVCLGLKGAHQIENAETAINVVKVLRYDIGLDIEDDFIVDGLEKARHPGRLEYVGDIILDGAHNVAGVFALRTYLDECELRPITLVFGVMREKNVSELAAILFPKATNIVLTAPSNTRSMSPTEILKSCDRELWRRKVVTAAEIDSVVDTAISLAGDDGLVLVTGSLYLVGEVKKLLADEETSSQI